jgi:serine phosphatase RsbU (regulator of sigma subunit)/putative methionine-R-sulfoxide reductase with GAF domain
MPEPDSVAERRLNGLLTVAEVGRKLTSILDLDQLLTQVVELIQSRFGYYHVQIFLIERGSDRAYFKASKSSTPGSDHELNEKWKREGRSTRIGQEGIIGWVAQHGESLLANDVSAEPRYIPDDPRLLPDTRAELAVPLIVEGEVLGVLDVQSTETGAFGPDDLFVLTTLADQVAVAVNSARAYEAQQEEAWLTTVMLQVAEATGQADGIGEVLDAAVRVITMLAGVDSCTIWLWDDDFEAFHYGADHGLTAGHPGLAAKAGELDPAVALRFRPGDWSALDQLRASKVPVVIQRAAAWADLPPPLRAICPGDTVALLPMLNKGQVFGVMGVSLTQEWAPGLNERRLAMLSGTAHQVAAAVDNSRLAAAQQEEAWISTVLLQVAEAMSRLQPLDLTLAQVARLTPRLAGVDRCAVLLREQDGTFRVRTAHALRPGLAEVYHDVFVRPGDLPLLDDACRSGQPLVVDNVAQSERVPEAWRARFASRTLLVVPLLVADEVIGALLADDVDSTYMFSPRRVRIMAGIASQTAIAIENARLQAQEAERARLSRELELAHDIQRSLLPPETPQPPGYQIVYRWRSAHEVGGDFFDFIPLPTGNLGIVVADVSDKGIPAALYMMFARTLLRAVAFSGREPAAILARTNELIVADSTSDFFVTVYYSVLDARNHTLTYASAGHNLALYAPGEASEPRPPLGHFAGSRQAQPMITAGIALGIVVPATIEQQSLTLAPGDVVLFYTDGVTESENPQGEQFGEARLAQLLCTHRHEPVEAIADAIEAAVRAFVGPAAQADDFTLVLVKRTECHP